MEIQLKQKGVYHYDYLDFIKRLHETDLPPKEAFHSILKQENISDED